MRRKLLLLLLIIPFILCAQLPKSLVTDIKDDVAYKDYTGSIYLSINYQPSSVIHEKSNTYDARLRYNIYTDAIEYKSNSDLYELIKNPTTHVRIDKDYFYYCDFESQRGINNSGYFILVELNDLYSIYKKITLNIKDPEKIEGVGTSIPRPGKIRQVITYYIEEAGVIMELPLNKKEMLATFSDKGNELKGYLKKEKIRLKKEEDLIRFVAKYNALKRSDSGGISESLLSNSTRGN